MRSLHEFKVEVCTDDEGEHAEITIEWAAALASCDGDDATAFGHPTKDEHVKAALVVAGLLGRLAWAAHPWLAEGGQQHRCSTRWFWDINWCAIDGAPSQRSGCKMTGIGIFDPLRTPLDHTTDGIYLCLRVPPGDIPAWLDRIRGWLQALAEPEPVP